MELYKHKNFLYHQPSSAMRVFMNFSKITNANLAALSYLTAQLMALGQNIRTPASNRSDLQGIRILNLCEGFKVFDG